MSDRRLKIGDVVEIQDLAGSINDESSWHRATVVEIKTARGSEDGIPRFRARVDGIGDLFWRRMSGPDKRWRRVRE